MRRLLLLRHAKATVMTGREDHERALIERGRRDAARIAAFVGASGLTPELVIHSGARRARETAEIARAAWPRVVEARAEPRLYEASRPAIEAIVRALPDGCASVMLVAHNPGLADAANHLIGDGADVDLLRISAKFPTAGLAALEFDVKHWRDVEPGSAKLACFATPDDPKVEKV
jgi:phosphohistidine phosphatase